ncbi:PAS domain S-box protein [Aliikangiella marina]|uniref:PAS domain S-box protein n=1 Tax=Aliikangiella marina TaxID=1712262 RepID=A0A545T928_9GAMM|nr:PAS domain-containing protein [Aliikangiella marina]TQV73688.1 PAS domain S-box protein [Aliikangiella marina]
MDLTRFHQVEDYSILDCLTTHADQVGELFSVFNDLPILTLVVNQEAKMAYLNPEGASMLNIPIQQYHGECWLTKFIPGEQRQEIIMVFEQVINGNIAPYSTNTNDVLTADGSIIPFKWTNHLLTTKDGTVKGVCCFGSDSRDPHNEVDHFVDLSFPSSLK